MPRTGDSPWEEFVELDRERNSATFVLSETGLFPPRPSSPAPVPYSKYPQIHTWYKTIQIYVQIQIYYHTEYYMVYLMSNLPITYKHVYVCFHYKSKKLKVEYFKSYR